jgi:hypothetical protein
MRGRGRPERQAAVRPKPASRPNGAARRRLLPKPGFARSKVMRFPSTGFTRRRLLGGSALALFALLGARRVALAQAQMAKDVAHYQDKPKGDQSCDKCRFFKPPKSCQLVAGDISAEGWCTFFNPKS